MPIDYKEVAAQLRKPSGDFGKQVGINMNEGNALINKRIIELLQIVSGDYVLEIGMGNGKFVGEILSHHPTVKYIGRDFSDVMVAEAKRINEQWINGGRAKFYEGVADTLSARSFFISASE